MRLPPTRHDYHLFHATRADLLRRVGALDSDALSYTRALTLVATANADFWSVACTKSSPNSLLSNCSSRIRVGYNDLKLVIHYSRAIA